MRIAYFHCFAGASGDMILGALLDAGLPWERLQADLARLSCGGFRLEMGRVTKQGIAGVRLRVLVENDRPHRRLDDVRAIIAESTLPDAIRERSMAVFTRLAEAEAQVHGQQVEEIHFHEVGALDAIVDVVGVVTGLWRLGIEEVYASPVNVGSGFVRTSHGILPVPGPAVMVMLPGVPVYARDAEEELLTPTGAAILTTCCSNFGPMPPMLVVKNGYGAGERDLPIPNLLRVTIGEKLTTDAASRDNGGCWQSPALMLEANIDDMNPEFYEHLMEELLAEGAMDVFLQTIQMKKNRPAVTLCVLMRPEDEAKFRWRIFAETTTLGVRMFPVTKHMLPTETITLNTSMGPARVKVGRQDGKICTMSPEYEDCRRLAKEHHLPLKEVYDRLREEGRRCCTGK